jgi:hypothetical protein
VCNHSAGVAATGAWSATFVDNPPTTSSRSTQGTVVVFGLFAAIIGVVGLAVWLYALVDVIRTPDGQYRAGNQLIWILVILFANVIGAIIYLAVGRPSR